MTQGAEQGSSAIYIAAGITKGFMEEVAFKQAFMIATGEAIPLRGLEGVPGLPGAPQDEAGLTRKFETCYILSLLVLRRSPH